jgi:hypothetical protein
LKHYIFLSLVIIILYPLTALSFTKEDLSIRFHKANEAYLSGNYEEALTLYKKMIDSGFENGYIYYNLGNTFFKSREIGKSIFHYRLAQKYIPRNADLMYNLNFAREHVIDKIEKKKSNKILSTVVNWHESLNRKETLIVFILSSSVFWIIWIVRLFVPIDWLKWVQLFFLFIFILFTTALMDKQFFTEPFGVIASKEASVYSSPGTDNVVLFVLHEGVEFTVLDRFHNEWIKIGLDDGKKGWLPIKDVYLSTDYDAIFL